jgi:hypothetical protein
MFNDEINDQMSTYVLNRSEEEHVREQWKNAARVACDEVVRGALSSGNSNA